MKQFKVDKFINSSLHKMDDIIDDITTFPNKIVLHKLIDIIDTHRDYFTPYLDKYIRHNYSNCKNNDDIIEEIQFICREFYDIMMKYMKSFGYTPNGFKRAEMKWKKIEFHKIIY